MHLSDAIFESSPIGIILTDLQGYIFDINPFALQLFGSCKNELIGEHIAILIPAPQYLTEAKEFKPGKAFSVIGNRKNGSSFPIEVSAYHNIEHGSDCWLLFLNKQPAIAEELKPMEQSHVNDSVHSFPDAGLRQLQINNDRLNQVAGFQKAVIENAGAMIIATDKNGIIKLFNPEAEKKTGYTSAELVDKQTPLLFHVKEEIDNKRRDLLTVHGMLLEDDFAVVLEASSGNTNTEQIFTHVRKDGTTFPVSLTITPIYNRHKEIDGYIGVVFDISERVKATQEYKDVQNLFLQLLQNYPDGAISIINRDFKLVYTGGKLFSFLNANPRQMIGKKLFAEDNEALATIFESKLSDVFSKKVFLLDFELPLPIAGNIYVMDAFPLLEADGSVNNAGVIIRSISDLKKAEDNLREALRTEKELSELRSRFVSMASHEFGTPLSTILSSAYLIEKFEAPSDQPKRMKHVQRIVSAVNVLSDTLNDFLTVSNIDQGRFKVVYSEFVIPELMTTILGEMKISLKKQHEILYTHQGKKEIMLDTALINRLVFNLVVNASKYSPELRPIEVATAYFNHQFTISVKDYGIGISEEDQKHLTERFFRGSNASNIQGTGLGIHLVSKYAELMNGRLSWHSELEKGSEFIVTFNTKPNDYENDIADRG